MVATLAVVAGSLAATVAPASAAGWYRHHGNDDYATHDLVNYHVNLTDDHDIDDRYAIRGAARARLRRPSRGAFLPCAPTP